MTLIDKDEVLLPCPFCGKTPEPPVDATRILGIWRVIHKGCTTLPNFAVERADKSEAIAAWNRRALPARGVGVKPLVWELATTMYEPCEAYQAICAVGVYVVAQDEDSPCQFTVEYGVGPDTFHKGQPLLLNFVRSLDAAKAAAQADYEARILAALSPAAQPGEDVEAQAREAALAVLAGLSSYLGTGLGDDDTTAEQFDKRIRWAIDDLTARTRQAALKEAAEQCEGYGATGEMISDAILALIGEPRT